jgi:hypothetical protein
MRQGDTCRPQLSCNLRPNIPVMCEPCLEMSVIECDDMQQRSNTLSVLAVCHSVSPLYTVLS